MIAIGIHFNARLHTTALKTGVKGRPRLNGAESGSKPFAGLRDAIVMAFHKESFPPYLGIRKNSGKEELGNPFIKGFCWFLKNRGQQAFVEFLLLFPFYVNDQGQKRREAI